MARSPSVEMAGGLFKKYNFTGRVLVPRLGARKGHFPLAKFERRASNKHFL